MTKLTILEESDSTERGTTLTGNDDDHDNDVGYHFEFLESLRSSSSSSSAAAAASAGQDVAADDDQGDEESSSSSSSVLEYSLPTSSGRTKTIRLGHIVSLIPSVTIGKVGLSVEIGGFLAMKDFNQRNSSVLPFNLRERLKGCNLYLTMDLLDTETHSTPAVQKLLDKISPPIINTTTTLTTNGTLPVERQQSSPVPPVMAMLGAGYSVPSQSLAIIGGIQNIPQCSCCATSQELDDNTSQYPFFTRTMPSNQGEATAAAYYFHYHLGVEKAAVLYESEIYAQHFAKHFGNALAALGDPYPLALEYNRGDVVSLQEALEELATSQIRYIYVMNYGADIIPIAEIANSLGIMGNQKFAGDDEDEDANNTGSSNDGSNHFWLWAQTAGYVKQQQGLNHSASIIQALHGTGAIHLEAVNPSYNAALKSFQNDPELQQSYVRLQERKNQPFFDDFDFSTLLPLHWGMLNYDAMMTLGIAACEASTTKTNTTLTNPAAKNATKLLTGPRLYESILQTEFEGASGYVAFNPETGTRNYKGLRFIIQNIRTSQSSEDDTMHVEVVDTAIVDPSASTASAETAASSASTTNRSSPASSPPKLMFEFLQQPFLYNDNTTTPPPSLPPVQHDMNLIGTGFLTIGLVLASIIMLLSIGWIVWVSLHRKERKVASSQPFFLNMICIGTFLMATSIIPTSFQEPMDLTTLDVGCSLFPWLLCLGFVTTFSALFTKNGRMNTLYANAKRFRRVTIEPKDVLLPFVMLLVCNIAILTAMTITDPWVWVRSPSTTNHDVFGRSIESFGVCQSDRAILYTVLLSLVNFIPVLLSNYQSYKSRNLPSEYSESKYVAYCMASILESVLIGGPILIMAYVAEKPSAFFMARAIITFIVCLAILLFMFVPKLLDVQNDKSTRRLTMVTAPRTSSGNTTDLSSFARNFVGGWGSSAFVGGGGLGGHNDGMAGEDSSSNHHARFSFWSH